MSCSHVQRLIFAERDGPLASSQRAELDDHLGHCATCAKLRAELNGAVLHWKEDVARVAVPEATKEWFALRRNLREGAARGAGARRRKPSTLAWLSIPIAAAIAVVFAFRSPSPPGPAAAPVAELARAEYVDVPGNTDSTMVYVDNTSGWLVVWAPSAPGKG